MTPALTFEVKILVPDDVVPHRVTVFTEADALDVARNMLNLPRVETVSIEAQPSPYQHGVFAMRYVHRANGAGGESYTLWSCWAPDMPVVHRSALDGWLESVAVAS